MTDETRRSPAAAPPITKPSIEQVLRAAELPEAAIAIMLENIRRMTEERRRELAAAIAND